MARALRRSRPERVFNGLRSSGYDLVSLRACRVYARVCNVDLKLGFKLKDLTGLEITGNPGTIRVSPIHLRVSGRDTHES